MADSAATSASLAPLSGCSDSAAEAGLYLAAVLDGVHELSGLIQPQRILEVGLLAVMGPLGVTSGLLVFSEMPGGRRYMAMRGFAPDTAQELADIALDLVPSVCGLGATFSCATPPGHPLFNLIGHLRERSPNAAQLCVAVPWNAGPDLSGALLLGPRIAAQNANDELDPAQRNLALELTSITAGSLHQALSSSRIGQMGADLMRKNDALELALERAERMGRELDRKIFHLGTLNDLSGQLAGETDTQILLDLFLLHSLGTFQATSGYLLLHDRESRTVRTATRGMNEAAPDAPLADEVLYDCLSVARLPGLTSMAATPLLEPEVAVARLGLSMAPSAGAFFVIDRDLMGLCLLGPALDDGHLAPDEAALFTTQLQTLMAHLKNARAFETITTLNAELEQSNTELRSTIEDLTEARQTISVLEGFNALFRSSLKTEMQRIGQARPYDYVLLILVSVLLALLFNTASPNGIALVPDVLRAPPLPAVTANQAMEFLAPDKTAILIDARPAEDYRRAHLPGAINVPPGFFDMTYMMRLAATDLDTPVVVYGRTVSRLYDLEVANRLKKRDHTDVRVLTGGIDAWMESGMPTEAQK